MSTTLRIRGRSRESWAMRLFGLLLSGFVALGWTGCGGELTSSRLVLRVDQTLDRSTTPAPMDPIPDAAFKPQAPEDRYEVAVSGDHVTIVPFKKAAFNPGTFDGTRVDSPAGEQRFDLSGGTFAGGRLVLKGGRGELTIYGSGVPFISSERGTLVVR